MMSKQVKCLLLNQNKAFKSKRFVVFSELLVEIYGPVDRRVSMFPTLLDDRTKFTFSIPFFNIGTYRSDKKSIEISYCYLETEENWLLFFTSGVLVPCFFYSFLHNAHQGSLGLIRQKRFRVDFTRFTLTCVHFWTRHQKIIIIIIFNSFLCFFVFCF